MSHECPEPMDLAALLPLPEDDPRRRAAVACPRCDALMRSLTAFMAGDDTIPGDERRAAERRLEDLVAGLAGGRVAAPAGGAPRAAWRAPASRSRFRPRARDWGWTAGLAAAAAVVVLLVADGEAPGTGAGGGRLRGAHRDAQAGIELRVAASAGSSDVSVEWAEVAGADRYRLEVFATDLDTLAVLDALVGPHALVPADALAGEERAMCRVRAYAGTAELASSALVEFPAR